MDPLEREVPPPPAGDQFPPFRRPPRDRRWLHGVLLLVTILSTSAVGGCHYRGFLSAFQPAPPSEATTEGALWLLIIQALADPTLYLQGLWYSATILLILGCHEMGHYIACRRYGVDASLPYFLPAPLPLTGTLGAFIRIRSRMPSKVALFDIGIAGPIAGFVVAVPALVLGCALSTVVPLPAEFSGGLYLGEPLLFRAVAWLFFGSVPDGYAINMHPVLFASWFGLLATSLNLFPISQLDGGHIAYAVLGRRASLVTLAMVCVAVGLTFFSSSWTVWTVLMVVMLIALGPHHPPTLDDEARLGPSRLALTVFAVVMLIICFTPAPIETLVTGQ